MHLAILTIRFQLPGCRSLKEKRRRLSGLKDKFGKIHNIAVSEADFHDRHQQAEWYFAIISNDKTLIEQQITKIELHAASELDAVVEDCRREWL